MLLLVHSSYLVSSTGSFISYTQFLTHSNPLFVVINLTQTNRYPTSSSPYSFILDLTSFFSCFGMGNRRFQPVCRAYFRTLGWVPGTDVRGS